MCNTPRPHSNAAAENIAIGELTPENTIIYKYNGSPIDDSQGDVYILNHDRVSKSVAGQNAIINIGAPDSREVVHPSKYIGKIKDGYLNDKNGELTGHQDMNFYKFKGTFKDGKLNGPAKLFISQGAGMTRYDIYPSEFYKMYKQLQPPPVKDATIDFIRNLLSPTEDDHWTKVEQSIGRVMATATATETATATVSIYLHGSDNSTERLKYTDKNVKCRLLTLAGETCSSSYVNHLFDYVQSVYDIITKDLGYRIIKSGEIPKLGDFNQISTFKYLEILQRVIAYNHSLQIVNMHRLPSQPKDGYYLDKGSKIITPVVEHSYYIDSDDVGDETGIFIHDFETGETRNILLDILEMIYNDKKKLFVEIHNYVCDIIDTSTVPPGTAPPVKPHGISFKVVDAKINLSKASTPRETYVENRKLIIRYINALLLKINTLVREQNDILTALELKDRIKWTMVELPPLKRITLSEVMRFFSRPDGVMVILNIIDNSCRSGSGMPDKGDKDLLHLYVAEKQGLTALKAYGGGRNTRKSRKSRKSKTPGKKRGRRASRKSRRSR